MSSFVECLKEPIISNILIGVVLYVGFSLVLIIVLISIIFKMLNKNKEVVNGTTKD
jgi:hypothetical protein